MKFHKYHALGNDYIVLDPDEFDEELTEGKIRRICHRNYGVGSDGILMAAFDQDVKLFGVGGLEEVPRGSAEPKPDVAAHGFVAFEDSFKVVE